MVKKKQEGKFNMGVVCPFVTYEKFTLSLVEIFLVIKHILQYNDACI